MSKRHFLRCMVLAAGSFGVTLALIGPARLNADGPNDPSGTFAAPVGQTVKGVQFSVRLPNSESTPRGMLIESGKNLKFELVATNTLDTPVEMPAKVALSSTEPVQKMSRMLPMYQETWQSEGTIKLAPKEQRVVSLSADVELKPASNVLIQVTSPDANNPPQTIGTVRRAGTLKSGLFLSVKGEAAARTPNPRAGLGSTPATQRTIVVSNFTLDR